MCKFDLLCPYDDLPEYFLCIYYGLRRSGKTTMLRTMLFEMQDRLEDHFVYLFSTTAEVTPEDYLYIPKKAKFNQLGELEHDLGKIVSEQKAKMKAFHDGESENEPDSILIILDDCVSESSIRNCPSLNTLAVAGRHLHISVIILSQVVAGSGSVPPIIRTQADLIFVVAHPRSERERSLIAEQYLTADGSMNARRRGMEVMAAVTDEQYRALVILTTDSSARKFEEYLLMYGPVDDALVDPDFKLGTEDQWKEEDPNSTRREKRKFQPTARAKNPEATHLPNPFSHAPDLARLGNEYRWALSDNMPKTMSKRRR